MDSAQGSTGQTPARLTTSEFAERVGLTARQVRNLIRTGRLTVVKIAGAQQTIPVTEAERLIREATIPAKSCTD